MESGWLGNPNIFGPFDKEATSALRVRAASLIGGRTAASDHDMQTIMKMNITPPVGGNSINHLRRLKIVGSVCLPEGHKFLVWVQKHIAKFNNFCFPWTGLKMQDLSLQHMKGVICLNYLKLRFSRHFKQQRKTSMPQSMEEPDHTMSRIQDANIVWVPPILFGLHRALGVASLLRLGNPSPMHKPQGAGTLSTTGSTGVGTMIQGIISAGGGVPGGVRECRIPNQRSHHRGLAQDCKGRKG